VGFLIFNSYYGRKTAPIINGTNAKNAKAGCPLLVLFWLSQLNRLMASPNDKIPVKNKIRSDHIGL
jgi:hypothetical protein